MKKKQYTVSIGDARQTPMTYGHGRAMETKSPQRVWRSEVARVEAPRTYKSLISTLFMPKKLLRFLGK